MRTIGRVDKVDFPDLGLTDIDAKIDSGAFTSSLHGEHIEAFYQGDQHKVRFEVPELGKKGRRVAPVFASKQVKNSFGQVEYRYSIKTPIVLFDRVYVIELALTNRSAMKYPVLIGRKVLGKRFVVDVSKKYLSYREKLAKSKEAQKTIRER